MDRGAHPQPPSPRSSSSPTPVRTASAEHAESPLKKKPRLESNSSTRQGMSDLSNCNNAASPSPSSPQRAHPSQGNALPAGPQTPSKLTVDLRRSKPPPSPSKPVNGVKQGSNQVEMGYPTAAQDGTQRDDRLSSSPNTVNTIEANGGSEQDDDPPVVEIKLDDEDEEDAGAPIHFPSPTTTSESTAARIIDEFPVNQGEDPLQRLKTCCVFFDTDATIDWSILQEIYLWMVKWLRCTGVEAARWRALYAESPEFWSQFATLFGKLISKRQGTDDEGESFSADSSNARCIITGNMRQQVPRGSFIQDLLFAYVRITGHLLRIDLDNLPRILESASRFSDFRCFRHLRNLSNIFSLQDFNLGQMLRESHGIDPVGLKMLLSARLLECSENIHGVLSELMTQLSNSLNSRPFVNSVMKLGLTALRGILSAIGTQRPNESDTEPTASRANQFARRALEATQTIEQNLGEAIEKQKAVLVLETHKDLINGLCDVIYTAGSANPRASTEFLARVCGTVENIPVGDHAVMLRSIHDFKLLWRCISKGRMELRVFGVTALGEELVHVWESRRLGCSDPTTDPVIRSMAELLARERVIEYIVSADSHPQLISRSVNVLSYSLVVRHWTPEMTEAVWNTISLSQDPRIVTAVLETLIHSVRLAGPAELLDFCVKMNKMPLKAFDNTMLALVEHIFQRFNSTGAVEDEKIIEPYKLCVRLIRESLISEHESTFEYQRIHARAYNLLQELSRNGGNAVERQSIYLDCVRDVQDGLSTATGSLSSINALLAPQKSHDGSFVTERLDLLTVVIRDLCIYSDKARAAGPDAPSPRGLEVRLQLLIDAFDAAPSYKLGPALEKDLWDHIVGEKAIDDRCREVAFSFLRNFARLRSHTHPFIDHCVQDFLPLTDPKYFTNGLVTLIKGIMQYAGRVTPPPSPKEDQVICDPLGDILWRLILGSRDDGAAQNSIMVLSSRQVDKSLLKRVPVSAVAATHRAIVERSINQLKVSSSKLKSASLEATPADSASNHGEDTATLRSNAEEVKFIRSLQFLREFLLLARRHSEYHIAPQEPTPPSPEMIRSEKTDEEQVTLKYQASGIDEDPRELQIASRSNYLDLSRKLQELTLFPEIYIVVGGQRLDLSRDPTHPIRDLADRGLIIVAQPQGTANLPPSTPTNMTDSVAESAVLSHFNELYELLDLDSSLSYQVYEFLGAFPTHGDIEQAVLSGQPRLLDLFPEGKVYRSLYNLRTLHSGLVEQLKSSRVDPHFVIMAVRTFIGAIIDEDVLIFSRNTAEDFSVQINFVEYLKFFLKHVPIPCHEDVVLDPATLVNCIWKFFGELRQMNRMEALQMMCSTYEITLDLSLRSAEFAKSLRLREGNAELHSWLLLYQPNWVLRDRVCVAIDGITRGTQPSSSISAHENVLFYWNIVKEIIPLLPSNPSHSKEFLSLALVLLDRNSSINNGGAAPEYDVQSWSKILLSHDHVEVPGQNYVDHFIIGFARLLNASVAGGRISETFPSVNGVAEQLFDKFLYPSIANSSPGQTRIPVLHSETRKELFRFVLSLCDSPDCFAAIASSTSCLAQERLDQEQTPTIWDNSRVLRSSAGYVGLSNLTNTCYMNSLVTQLFMNPEFRQFMLKANVVDARGSQQLLAATQDLFNVMQHTHGKQANTEGFAAAIVPYDAPQIDVSIQMDVDEFYNLVFDRWEGQMMTREDKDKFRSFYGGQLVTQIKSLGCGHVSERSEPFMTISCEVKDRSTLQDSLEAYVQGDAMEGDNKYMCEACDGRFVNAVKRSCLRDVPDNLIFHLKRFDFDLTSFQRSKINDRFDFPVRIDMSRYKYAHLIDSTVDVSEDWFDLVGILVHNGTAEAGHYYSYIRTPQDSPTAPGGHWVEFNDADVSYFDANKIPDACFGGPWETQHHFGWNMLKPWNAYMLFYRRTSSLEQPGEAQPTGTPNGVEVRSTPSTADLEQLKHDNNVLLRWYCLFDQSHAYFVHGMLSKLQAASDDVHPENHVLAFQVIGHSCDYVHQFASQAKDVPDLEPLLQGISRVVDGCAECRSKLLDFFEANKDSLFDMLLRNPMLKTRQLVAEFVVHFVSSARSMGKAVYGVDINTANMSTLNDYTKRHLGILPRVMRLLQRMIVYIGRYARLWDEYFLLWCQLVSLGIHETAMAISQDLFAEAVELFLLTDPPVAGAHIHDQSSENQRNLARFKRGISTARLIQLLSLLLKQLDTSKLAHDSWSDQCSAFDEERMKFPVTSHERTLLRHKDRTGFGFVAKVVDAWEKDYAPPFAPSDIIMHLLQDTWENDPRMLISQTLLSSIDDYFLEALEIPLRMAVTYCQYCVKLSDGKRMIQAVADNVKEVEKHRSSRSTGADNKDENGLAFVNFFLDVVALEGSNTRVDRPPNEHPYLEQVLDLSHAYAPSLLFFNHQGTREGIFSFLCKWLLDSMPQFDAETYKPPDKDLRHATNVRHLFDACCSHWALGWNSRCSRTSLEPLYRTIERCFEWIENIDQLQHESPAYSRLFGGQEHTLIRKFREVQDARARPRPDEGDDTYGTETENASDYEDFESQSDEDTVMP